MQRKEITPDMSIPELVSLLGDGNPGAIRVISDILKEDAARGLFILLRMDDMNIRGERVWLGYKAHCGEDLKTFIDKITNRDPEMVGTINSRLYDKTR